MRRLGPIDLLVVALLVGLLALAARHDFGRYAERAAAEAPTALK
jgi:hypothetical protein